MPVVANYSRSSGTISGFDPGASGVLMSTRQKLPYDSAGYATWRMFIEAPPKKGKTTVKPYIWNALAHDNVNISGLERQAVQMARARLNKTLIKSQAALGITAATANQSFQMIAQRAATLRNAYSALRKGNLLAFSRTLGISGRKMNRRHKDAASLWLEYTFGWVPLVSDMYAAASVMTDPFEVTRSHGTGTMKGTYTSSGASSDVYVSKHTRAVCTAGLKVTNPNVALLTQLGLQNPAAVAWDIIPFSFVVDWFVKMNRFVNTWNDMAGFAYVDPITTVKNKVTGLLDYHWWVTDDYYTNAGNGRSRVRSVGIVNQPAFPTVSIPAPSRWLAVTSTSLLVQVFSKK